MAAVYSTVGAVSNSASESYPLSMLDVAKRSIEEPYALVRARTVLWEPVVGNCLGPPGQIY